MIHSLRHPFVRRFSLTFNSVCALLIVAVFAGGLGHGPGHARVPSREEVLRATVHPVASRDAMNDWLARVPRTRDWPPDFSQTLRAQASALVVEMSTAPGCLPCADLWVKLAGLRQRYGWRIGTVSAQEAIMRSGRLGLPWIGHPVVWVRPVGDATRMVPAAIGTDHAANIARNLYLAAKMLNGVRPDVGVRAMAKFTGIVGANTKPSGSAP
jgi:hypothetical protein